MNVFFKFEPSPERMARQFGEHVQGARRAGFVNVVTTIEAIATKDAPVRTSNLANTHTSEVNEDATLGIIRFTAPYAGYVHEGTGLYGPHRQKIVPKTKKALYWPGAAHPVRAVRGMKGQPFLRGAAEQADLQSLFSEGANDYLSKSGVR